MARLSAFAIAALSDRKLERDKRTWAAKTVSLTARMYQCLTDTAHLQFS